jgi:hypothetical protein
MKKYQKVFSFFLESSRQTCVDLNGTAPFARFQMKRLINFNTLLSRQTFLVYLYSAALIWALYDDAKQQQQQQRPVPLFKKIKDSLSIFEISNRNE